MFARPHILTDLFVSRGNADDPDFSTSDFDTDGDWHDLDLSSIIPVNANTALIAFSVKDDQVGFSMKFRPKGYTQTARYFDIYGNVADRPENGQFEILLNDDRVIQYYCSDRTWSYLYMTVIGWRLKK